MSRKDPLDLFLERMAVSLGETAFRAMFPNAVIPAAKREPVKRGKSKRAKAAPEGEVIEVKPNAQGVYE
jgi:hypothetical protein